MTWLSHWLRWQRRAMDAFGRLISWANLLIIVVLVWEVASRYLLASPTSWAHEASTMIYGAFCLAAGVYTQRHDGHVRVDVVYHLFPPRGRAVLDCISGALLIAALIVLLDVSWDFAWQSWQRGEVSSRSPWAPVLWPLKAVIPFTVALLLMQHVAGWLENVCRVLGHSMPDEETCNAT